ncbi:hypothetical protein D3C73_1097250 [compost metagenome]
MKTLCHNIESATQFRHLIVSFNGYLSSKVPLTEQIHRMPKRADRLREAHHQNDEQNGKYGEYDDQSTN